MSSTFFDAKREEPLALYYIDISKHLGPEYVGLFNDMSRFLTIQLCIQFMLYMLGYGFFTSDFILLMFFIVIGVCLYWLVFKKIVSFK